MDDLLAEFERPRQPSPEDKERRRRLFAAFGIAGLSLVALGSLTTNALFTDSDTVNSAGFVTGTVDVAASPKPVDFSATNMAPGDTYYATLTVNNGGSLGLRYAVSATATDSTGTAFTGTGSLSDQLEFSVYQDLGSCDAAGVAAATAGNQLGTTGVIGTGKTFSTMADNNKLAASASDDLCVVAHLPIGTGNAYQATGMTASFALNAEQIKNNP